MILFPCDFIVAAVTSASLSLRLMSVGKLETLRVAFFLGFSLTIVLAARPAREALLGPGDFGIIVAPGIFLAGATVGMLAYCAVCCIGLVARDMSKYSSRQKRQVSPAWTALSIGFALLSIFATYRFSALLNQW